MPFKKFMLFFAFVVAASTLNAEVTTMSFYLADEAQAKADKILNVEGELKRLFGEAASSGDSEFKACVGSYFGTVKGISASANGMVSQIVLLLTSNKMTEAQYQMSTLDGLVGAAEQTLARAQNCKRKEAVQDNRNKNDGEKNQNSDAGSNLQAKTDINATVKSDPADAVGADDVQLPENENSGIFFSFRYGHQDTDPLEEEEIVEQSPTE